MKFEPFTSGSFALTLVILQLSINNHHWIKLMAFWPNTNKIYRHLFHLHFVYPLYFTLWLHLIHNSEISLTICDDTSVSQLPVFDLELISKNIFYIDALSKYKSVFVQEETTKRQRTIISTGSDLLLSHVQKLTTIIECLFCNANAVGLKPSKLLTVSVLLHLYNTWFIQQWKTTLMLIWLMCLCGRFPMQGTLHTAKSFQEKW